MVRNEAARATQLRHVHTGLDTESVEQIDDVFGRDIAGGTLRIRAAAESGHRAVERRHAEFERRVDVRERLSVRVVEMTGKCGDRHLLRYASQQHLCLAGSAGADRVAEGADLVDVEDPAAARDEAR